MTNWDDSMKDIIQDKSLINGKPINILIDFDLIIESDFGLIKFIQQNYMDERAFKLDILNSPDQKIIELLYSRENRNPLSIISTDENLDNIDNLYQSFFETYKREILRLSITQKSINTFLRLMGEGSTNLGIAPNIAVNDDIEKKFIEHRYDGFNFVYKNDIDTIASKDAFYIKDYAIFQNVPIETIRGKKIYLLPLEYSINRFTNPQSPEYILNEVNEFVLFGIDYRKKENVDG